MTKSIYELHDVVLPDGYMPSPGKHLANVRDCEHYLNSLDILTELAPDTPATVLDIGSWDGWLPLLLARDGYDVTAVEFIPALVEAGRLYARTFDIKNFVYMESDWLSSQPSKMSYDLVTAYEVLEHVTLDVLPEHINKMERYGRNISISLPDQDHHLNPQHQWTPTQGLIEDFFGKKKNVSIRYKTYPGSTIPSNWFVTYGIGS